MPIPEYIRELRKDVGTRELYLPGVTAVVIRRETFDRPLDVPEVLLVKRSDNGDWGVTSGILEPGEEPAVAAAREVEEEAGILSRPVRVAGISDGGPVVYPNGDRCAFIDITFEMEYLSGQAQVCDDESTEAGWFPIDALPVPFTENHRRRIAWAADSGAPARF